MRGWQLIIAALPVAAIAAIALLVPWLGLPDPTQINVAQRLSPPSWTNLLGRDEFGRDVLSQLLWGARVSLTIALASAALSCLVGSAIGIMGGYFRGLAELVSMRSADIILCFPPLLLALLVVTLLGPGALTLVPVLALVYLPNFVRIAYATVLSIRSLEYVEAARSLGERPTRILARTILPNAVGPILVQFSLSAAATIVMEAGLSFLGLGVVPPAPSWGLMIASGRGTMGSAPWLLMAPCAALMLTILAMNRLCDALGASTTPPDRGAAT